MYDNKFDALQEIPKTLTPNNKYENAGCIPTKLRAEHRAPWEILTVKKNETT